MFKTLIEECQLRNYSKRTSESYLYFNKKFIKFCNKKTQEVNYKDIRSFLLHLISRGYSSSYVNLAHNSINFYYTQICKRKFEKISFQKREQKIKEILSKEEIVKLIEVTDNIKHKLIISLLYSSGIRISELIKIKLNDIDLKNKTLLVKQGKGKKDRYVIASKKFIKDAMQYLESRKDNNPYMFISDHNKEQHITIRTAEEIVKKSAKSANIRRRVFPHALRSTFATHLYQNGVDAFSLQKLLGHARIETTRGYTKTDFRMINSITSPLDLD